MNFPTQIGNTVLPSLPPQPRMHKFPTLDLVAETLPGHNASLQPFMAGTGPRPSGNFMPNMPVLNIPRAKVGAENFAVALPTNHSVHESFGGSPRWEAEQMGYRPTNPRSLGVAPQVRIEAEPRTIPIRESPVLPKANLPNLMDFSKVVKNANPMILEARPTSPPVRNADLGGLLSSTSRFGGIGNSPGRAFGAESFLLHTI